MSLILVALIVLAVLAILLVYANRDVASAMGIAGAFAAGIGLTAYAFAAGSYFAAEHKANIINREYGTQYTQAEVYWAADVIDIVRQLDRKRVELNGGRMKDEP